MGSRILAVCAHPDDESFGLGGVVDALARAGAAVAVLCFTHGEASTLSAGEDLGTVRGKELAAAAAVLGIAPVTLLDYPDGELAATSVDELAEHVESAARAHGAGTLLVFDEGGVTGHPDHRQATDAALVAAAQLDLPVLAWAVPEEVAAGLNGEMGTAFVGRNSHELCCTVTVDRDRQRTAIACHASQARDNPVLHRRLTLLGDQEALRWLRRRT